MASDPRREAQARADQIRAFRRELHALETAGVLQLTPEQRLAVTSRHDDALTALARDFDVDRSDREGQLSRGLRLASLIGAAALVAAITTLVNRVWNSLGLAAQVTLLIGSPLAALAGVQLAAERERTRYVAGLFALVACGTAWFAIGMVAQLLNIPISELLLWPAAAFGLAVSLSYGFRLVFAASLVVLLVAIASAFFAAGGVPWPTVFERLEPIAGAAFVLVAAARALAPAGHGFEDAARRTGLIVGLFALLVLSNSRGTSLLAFAPATALGLYQGVFPVVALVLLWRVMRAGDTGAFGIVAAALGVFLLFRYVDWFWDRLPAWAFFLIMAAAAFASIAALRRARGREPAT